MGLSGLRGKRGFSLLELLTVVVIIGIAVGLFYTTFFYTWQAMDNYITRSDLMQDMDAVVDTITERVWESKSVQINGYTDLCLTLNAACEEMFLIDLSNNSLTWLDLVNGGDPRILAYNVDVDNSAFIDYGDGAVNLKLTLKALGVGNDVSVTTNMQVYPRNLF